MMFLLGTAAMCSKVVFKPVATKLCLGSSAAESLQWFAYIALFWLAIACVVSTH
jgi:hypothetical protein